MGDQHILPNDAMERKSSGPNLKADVSGRKRRSTLNDDNDIKECCDICQEMTGTLEGLRELVDYDEGYEQNSWYELQDSMAAGCRLCEHIAGIKADQWGEECLWDNEDDLEQNRQLLQIRIRLFATWPEDSFSSQRSSVQSGVAELEIPFGAVDQYFDLLTFEGEPVSTIVPGRRAGKDFGDDVALQTRKWLDNC